MQDLSKSVENRRRFLTWVGGSVAVAAAVGLAGCSSEQEPPASTAQPQSGSNASDAPAVAEKPELETAEMPHLAEDDAQAASLGYVHDAGSVDKAKYLRFQPGQECTNCALYQGSADDEWAACSIFAGKAVNGKGWCSVYAPKG